MTERFYFAWVDQDEEFDPAVHNRYDETVYSFTYDQSEGDFAGIKLDVKNPRIGLLNTGRKVWGILSFDDGTTITPLFRGRLIGVPSNVFDTIVTLDFVARPADFTQQKKTLADTMRVLPYWDPIFLSTDSWVDDDTVLEARSELWHIDPVTLVVTASDVLIPEDGTEEFTEAQHFYDDMQVTLNQTPLRKVSMVATIPWTQTDTGSVIMTRRILDAFGVFGSQLGDITYGVIESFSMKGLVSDWPKQGASFGSGWEVVAGECVDISYTYPRMHIPDIFEWQGVTIPDIPIGSVVFPLKQTGEYHSGETAGFNFNYELVGATIGYGVPQLVVTYTRGVEFAQIVTFTLDTDQQSIITLPGDDESLLISLNGNKVSDPTYDGSIPIGDVRRRDYVHTNRGIMSIEYLLLVARAHLISKSRAVEIQIKTGFKQGLRARSLRKAALVHDHRLPGGQAVGKIISFNMSLNGDDGAAECVITIASCVGYGGSYTTSPGTPSYVDDGYMDNTQQYDGQVVLTDTADIAWTIPPLEFFDDGLDFVAGLNDTNAVITVSVQNGSSVQEGVIDGFKNNPNVDQAAISVLLKAVPTKITAQMKPMEGGPFQQEVVVSVSDLIVPQQINLEAPSNA
jgi:hypothetical protein